MNAPSSAPSCDPLATSIVDDSSDDCWGMKRIVDRTPGLEWVGTHLSGQDALAAIPQSQTRIVLMDIRMPGMSGIECLWRLKADRPEIVVIMVTGYDDPHAIAAAWAAGADHCLSKPLEVGNLLVAVAFVLSRGARMHRASGNSSSAKRAAMRQPEKVRGPAAVLAGCLKRAQRWRVPLNWSAQEWLEELGAQAVASAFRAGHDYDESRGLSADAFVYFQVLADMLRLYRKEWRFALRCLPLGSSTESNVSAPVPAAAATTDQAREQSGTARVSYTELHEALAGLPPASRELIEQLFWKERKEVEVAGELGISHQAVSKRKHAILRRLAEDLDGQPG